MKNITKTTKIILFASLIAALVLPFSGMNYAAAEEQDELKSMAANADGYDMTANTDTAEGPIGPSIDPGMDPPIEAEWP